MSEVVLCRHIFSNIEFLLHCEEKKNKVLLITCILTVTDTVSKHYDWKLFQHQESKRIHQVHWALQMHVLKKTYQREKRSQICVIEIEWKMK